MKASGEEIDGQKDAAVKCILLRRGHTFQMTATTLLPEGGTESSIVLSDIIIARGLLDYPRTDDSGSVLKQWSTQGGKKSVV